jgi:protein O-mannosyl-transferase
MRVDRRDILLSLILFASTLIVFGQTCWNDFTNWDDPHYVVENGKVMSGLSLANARWAFTTFYATNWHPLTWLSLQLDAQLFGTGPGGFHLTNVLLHAVNAVLLYWVLRQMTGEIWRSGFVAFFFAFHPLHVESVAWISERKDVLSTFFWMSTCLAYGWYAARPGWFRYLATLTVFAAGLLAKPMLVTLPFVFLLLDYWPLRRNGGSTLFHWSRAQSALEKGPDTFSAWLLVEKVPFLGVAAGSCAVTICAQYYGGAIVPLEYCPFSMRLANAFVAYAAYIRQTVWPLDLGLFYWHPSIQMAKHLGGGIPSWQVAGAALALTMVTVFVCIKGRALPYLPVGWFWYLGTLVPVLGLVQVGQAGRADRYTYVPLVGLLIAAGWAIGDLARSWRAQRLAAGLGTLVLAACIILTLGQLQYWRSDVTLWEHTQEACGESPVAHTHLGIALLKVQSFEAAEQHFRKALELSPGNQWALFELGTALIGRGKIHEAVEQYREAIRQYPEFDRPHYSLGLALAELGRRQEAMAEQEEALRINPNFAAAHRALGMLFSADGKLDEAATHLRAAIEGGLVHPSVYYELARITALEGKFGEAIETLDRAVAIEPGEWRFRALLGLALYESGDQAAAVAQYREATRLNPGWPRTLSQKAWILATHPEPHFRNGKQSLQMALQVCQATANENAPYLDTLAAAYAEAGNFPRAIETAKQALAQAATEGNNDLAHEIKGRVELYEERKAFHGSGAPASK